MDEKEWDLLSRKERLALLTKLPLPDSKSWGDDINKWSRLNYEYLPDEVKELLSAPKTKIVTEQTAKYRAQSFEDVVNRFEEFCKEIGADVWSSDFDEVTTPYGEGEYLQVGIEIGEKSDFGSKGSLEIGIPTKNKKLRPYIQLSNDDTGETLLMFFPELKDIFLPTYK